MENNNMDMGTELSAVRRENQRLRQQLRWLQNELSQWQQYAILLQPEEIYEFYKIYRSDKRGERERAQREAMAEIDKLVAIVKQKEAKKNAENI